MEKTVRHTRKSLSCIFLILASGTAIAQPFVASSGLTQEGKLVLSGQSFGSGPNIVLYDNFNDARIIDGELRLAPQVGKWHELSASSPALHEDQRRDSSLVVRGPSYAKLTFGVDDSEGFHGLKYFQEVFFSYSVRDVGEFPGDNSSLNSFSNISSTKDAWMMFGGRGDNTEYAVSQGLPAGNDLYIPAWTGGGFNIAGNNTGMNPSFWQGELTKNWDFGGWNINMFHAELNPEDPYGRAEGFFSFINENQYVVNIRNGNFMEDLRSERMPYPFWDRIKFFAWLRTGDAEVHRLLDDVYVAIGPNANARLVITDGRTLEKSTMIYHLFIDQWSNDKITASIPEHILEDSNNNYFVTVINSNNERSTSFPLCLDCPSAPSLEIVQ